MSKRKLLLADDSATIQRVVNLSFADESTEVVIVGDGDAAMKKIVESAPDLVLADVNLSGLDGYRICELIKQDQRTRHIPVILLVGSFEPFDETEARRVGANGFLVKPFQSIRQLVDKVSDLLDEKKDEKDFLLPLENRAAPIVYDFHDLPETEPADEVESVENAIERLGDSGMDDRMIHTSQFDASATEKEITEYESKPVDESSPEEIELTSVKSPSNFGGLPAASEIEDEDQAKTQPLREQNIEEIAAASDLQVKKKNAPAVDFDDFDLLDFPQPMRKVVADPIVLPTDSEIFDETSNTSDEKKIEIPAKSVENTKSLWQSGNLSPELVEAVADRIVEKMSGVFIERIVREVIAQIEEER